MHTCCIIILDADFGASRWLMEEADAQVAAIKAAEAAEKAEFEKKPRRRVRLDSLGSGGMGIVEAGVCGGYLTKAKGGEQMIEAN